MILASSIFLAESALKIFYKFAVQGLENIPSCGRLIVACNHRSYVDPPAVGVAVSRVRKVFILAKQELFKPAAAGWYLDKLGAIPLDRHRKGGDISAIRTALGVLEKEGCLLLFPEGTRLKSGAGGRVKPGIGLLSHKADAPVVPAVISGTENFPKSSGIAVSFGKARKFEKESLEGRDTAAAYMDFAVRIMSDIANLEDERPLPR